MNTLPNLTIAMDKDLYRRMKALPEVNWSAVARKAFKEYLESRDDQDEAP